MLDEALLTSVAAVAALTIALLVAGRRPLPGTRWRWFVASCVVVASAVGALVTGSSLPVALGVAIAALSIVQSRNWSAVGATFFAALLVTTFVYAVYLARATLLLGIQPLSVVLGLVLLALEFGALALIVAAAFEMVDALCAPAEVAPEPAAPDRWPVVCLQVPTYNEPPDLVIETIRSLVALQYPELRIQIIDNNTANEGLWRPVEAECARLRDRGHVVQFVHLPEWPGYKAGALNWGRKHLAGEVEIVGVIDADYVVEPNWLRATVPHFGDPKVAFVQTPQDYRAWETSAFYRACYVGFAYFFKVGMVSRAHRNAIIFAGTMGLIRRDVLDAVGGWDERIITEDAEISLRVLARGARSIYVPQPFGRGIMPLTYEGLRKQRFRWAFGGMQILRRHWRTLLGTRSGLSFGQRYDHLIGGLWWLNDALTLGFTLFVSAAALGAITGRPFVVQRLTAIGLVLPIVYIVLNLIRYLWALRATTGASPALALAALRVNLSLSWVIALACVRGLVQERGVFLRTPKFRGSATIRELRVIWVEAVLGLVALILLALVLGRAGFAPVGLVLAALLGWVVLIYGSAVGYALGDPTRAPIGAGLRDKMTLEISPRIGRVAQSRPARAAFAATFAALFILAIAVASESGRATVGELPFPNVPAGPLRPAGANAPAQTGDPTGSASPAPSASVPAGTIPGGTPAVRPGPTNPAPRPTPTQASRSTPPGPPASTPSPGATPIPRPTPPVAVPTPTSHPTPPPNPGRTPRPRPTPSIP